MRITKKITSIVLAVLMVVSMMSVMAFSANAAVGDYVAEKDYLTFTSQEDESSVMLSNVQSGSDFQYNKNGDGWHDYNLDDYVRIYLNKGEYVRFRGSNTVSNPWGGNFSIRGKVAASGNIMSLRLDSESRSQGLTDECFHNMFAGCDGLITAPELPETTLAYECYDAMFEGCRNLTTAPELPATTLAYGCYADMFMNCENLTTAPVLPATSLAGYCYGGMFEGCTSLTELPALPATTLANYCYSHMFFGCSNIRISDEAGTINGIKYSEEYKIPSVGTATDAYEAMYCMFNNTGGKFTGTPSINTTYYIGKPVYTVTWKNGDTVIETDTDVAEGATPTFNGTTPEKAEDETNTYTFSGWSPAIAPVTADVTYTAQFTATPKHTEHTYEKNPTFNWSQDANGDWNCDTLTLTCSGCDATQDYEVAGFFGTSAVTVTANADGSFTYSVSKTVDGTKYEDSKTYDANSVVKSTNQLKAAAKKGGAWELGSDLTGVTDVQCANGFVLDGKNHTVTRHANVSTQAVFRTTTNPAEVTLKNLTIDGIAGQSDSKPAVATKMSNPSAGNVINLENVTITNYDFDASNNGVVLAWGQATVNMKNCTVDTDSDYDVWGGAASTINVDGGKVGTAYLNGGTSSAALTNGADVTSISASNGSTIKTDDPSIITAPADYKVKDNGDGTYSVVPKVYVAQVGSTKYETVQDAVAAAGEGGEVKLIADITGNVGIGGVNVPYNTTLDLNGHTITNNGGSGITLYSQSTNPATFTIKDSVGTGGITITKKYPGDGCISDSSGRKVVIEGGTYTSNDKALYISSDEGWTINGGTFNGKIHVISDIAIKDGTFNGEIVQSSKPDYSTPYPWTEIPAEIAVSGGSFDRAVPAEFCAEGFEPTPVDPVTGMYTVVRTNPLDAPITKADDGNLFGINSDYFAGTILGVQKKAKDSVDAPKTSDKGAQEAADGSDMRFVAVLDTETLQGADDYGFVLAKVGSDKNTTNTNFDNLKMGDDRAKTISAQNTYNNICGDEKYGDPTDDSTSYKYVTCAVNGVDDSSKIVARFYVVKGGKTYYAKYSGYNYQYRGVTAGIADLED